ncbi:MAG TPA: 3'-5' exonuclease [Actinomycetota bacterium]|nr:3'-5' exonuclease [Actinomycetota bacterium]
MSGRPDRPPFGSARHPWRQVGYASLDFETTGLDLDWDDVVSFGVVPVDGGLVRPGAATYREVAPSAALTGETIVVHGLRPTDLAEAPPLAEVEDELRRALSGRYVLAWSAGIEAAFLARVFGRSARWWRRRIIDVLRLAILADDVGQDRDFSLTAVADRLGVPVERPHHALDDALTTAQVFLVLLPELERRGIRTPRSLLRAGRG